MRIISLLLICLPLTTHALTLKTEARAASEQQAKQDVLAALADSILVEVKSENTSSVKGTGERKDEVRISTRSDIPLIGVDLSCVSTGRDVLCEAKLDSRKSLAIYASKLDELHHEIGGLKNRINKAEIGNRHPLLLQMLTLAEQYDKYLAVAQLLGQTQFSPPAITRSEIQGQIRTLEKLAPTLDLAAQLIAKGLSSDELYIYPASPQGSHEVTALSRIMRDKLAQRLNPVSSPDKAKHFMRGEYEQLDNSIHLTYRLLDRSGNTLETRIAALAPTAYKGVQVKPMSVSFDKLLHEGIVKNNDFKAQLNSNRGSESLLFNEKDEVELFVKVSRPGYFYVVGHVLKSTENYSYLLELADAERDRRFVRYVNADDANKWLSIGKFEATPPFGIESLQLIASSDDPINRLPEHQFDKKTEMNITAKNAQQGVARTRALKPKRNEADKNYQTESVLMFTTMPKIKSTR